MRITLLTVGSRGDVQPFLALGVGLARAGHAVTVATDPHFREDIVGRGLGFAQVRADFHAMAQSEEGKKVLQGSRLAGFRVFRNHVLPITRTMLEDTWTACQGAEAIVYHPKAFGAYDVAEKLKIPLVLAFYLPMMTPTRQFSHLGAQGRNLGRFLNRLSFGLNRLITLPFAGLRNKWRRETLGLPGRAWLSSDSKLRGQAIPAIYGFSEQVIPRPDDWPTSAEVSGFWFLERDEEWTPPRELVEFLEAGSPPIYVGFGSMTTPDPEATTRLVVTAVRQSGERAILGKGWGALAKANLPENIHLVEDVPHDWLFPRVSAVVHHGGVGTTSAGLRAGKPTLVCPFTADQPFWGKKVEELGVGPAPLPIQRAKPETLAEAMQTLLDDEAIRTRAEQLGEKLRNEDGVGRAVEVLERWLVR